MNKPIPCKPCPSCGSSYWKHTHTWKDMKVIRMVMCCGCMERFTLEEIRTDGGEKND